MVWEDTLGHKANARWLDNKTVIRFADVEPRDTHDAPLRVGGRYFDRHVGENGIPRLCEVKSIGRGHFVLHYLEGGEQITIGALQILDYAALLVPVESARRVDARVMAGVNRDN